MSQIKKIYKALMGAAAGALTNAATQITTEEGLEVTAGSFGQLLVSALAVGFLVWLVPNLEPVNGTEG